jgi:hypothetical protein
MSGAASAATQVVERGLDAAAAAPRHKSTVARPTGSNSVAAAHGGANYPCPA